MIWQILVTAQYCLLRGNRNILQFHWHLCSNSYDLLKILISLFVQQYLHTILRENNYLLSSINVSLFISEHLCLHFSLATAFLFLEFLVGVKGFSLSASGSFSLSFRSDSLSQSCSFTVIF